MASSSSRRFTARGAGLRVPVTRLHETGRQERDRPEWSDDMITGLPITMRGEDIGGMVPRAFACAAWQGDG